jgi:N-dimethylarginine dimethylaminohydrolase
MEILMCRPDHYGVEYEINPWMHVQDRVDRDLARRQWQALFDAYRSAGADVILEPQVEGLPDMVFSANAGLVRGRQAVLSRFRHAERRGEEPLWRAAFERRGFEVIVPSDEISFEGAGDGLFVGDVLFAGWGFRTDVASHAMVAAALDVEVVSLRLVDSRFYHLDTCFCPLNGQTVMFAPQAFAPDSAALIRARVPHVIEVPVDIAAGFACNALPMGDVVVSSESLRGLEAPLAAAGFGALELPMSEFLKSGGGVRCLSLPLSA